MGKVLGITPVPTEVLPSALSYVSDKLQAVYDKTHFWMPKDVLVQKLLDGTMGLWLVGDGETVSSVFCTRTVLQYDVKIVEIVLYSGEWSDEIKALLATVEDWARSVGADAVRVEGRWPWKRVLKSEGYTFEHVALFKLIKEADS